MTTNNTDYACAFTGHRPERLDASEEKVKKWLDK